MKWRIDARDGGRGGRVQMLVEKRLTSWAFSEKVESKEGRGFKERGRRPNGRQGGKKKERKKDRETERETNRPTFGPTVREGSKGSDNFHFIELVA